MQSACIILSILPCYAFSFIFTPAFHLKSQNYQQFSSLNLRSVIDLDDEDEYYDENFDLWGESASSDTTSSSSSISDSTLADIASDYHFPIDYIAHAVCSWGADPPIDVENRLGDLVNSEQCFALLEAITTLDPAEVDEAFSELNVAELSSSWGVEPGVVFEACVREGMELPFGVRTRIKEEDVDNVMRWCGAS